MLLKIYMGLFLGALQATVKSTKSIEKERKILTEIRDTLNMLLGNLG